MTRAARTWCSELDHARGHDRDAVTDNQMTTVICEDLARKNLAPGRSYPFRLPQRRRWSRR